MTYGANKAILHLYLYLKLRPIINLLLFRPFSVLSVLKILLMSYGEYFKPLRGNISVRAAIVNGIISTFI